MRHCFNRALAVLAGLSAVAGGTPDALAAPLRLNELQYIGTHNSYHVAPDAAVFEVMRRTNYRESEFWTAARLAPALSYTHAPIAEQLELGLRVFEFDLHDDPDGVRFVAPGFLRALTPEARRALAPVDPAGELSRPGLKVFHAADTDVRSRCLRFVACLQSIRAWSDAHPDHEPIIIQLETKEGVKPPLADAYRPVGSPPFGEAAFARLHAEILSVFPEERLVRPAEVRGDFDSVNAAVRAVGWPPVDRLRGRIIFLLLDAPEKQDEYAAFARRAGGALLFVSRSPEDPETGWLIRPEPDVAAIAAFVDQGFLVYTRADADGLETRTGDRSRCRRAVESGAQMIATDRPTPDPRHSDYEVSFDGAYVRPRASATAAGACEAIRPSRESGHRGAGPQPR